MSTTQTNGRVLPDLSVASREQLLALVAELKAANAVPTSRITFKVSEKGCVSVYGLNMRGIHLYASQWLRIFEHADRIKAFIEANRTKLAWKERDQ